MQQELALLDRPAHDLSNGQAGAGAPNYARRVDELGKIIHTYNEITEKLQHSHEQLTRTVISLRQELSEKNRLLERKNRLAAVGEMAAGMAHEIRNPLGGIQLYASLLAKDLPDRPASLELVRKISGGVKRLEGLVSQVLQFTRDIQLTIAEMDLAEVVQEAGEYAQQTCVERGVELVIQGPRSLPVQADALLISQVILNLILNGAEATEAGGKVLVEFNRERGREFWLVVSDTGPGISPAVIDRIFDPFFTTKATGTGLGLPIVHRIIEAHDGSITVCNQELGGARFEVRI